MPEVIDLVSTQKAMRFALKTTWGKTPTSSAVSGHTSQSQLSTACTSDSGAQGSSLTDLDSCLVGLEVTVKRRDLGHRSDD